MPLRAPPNKALQQTGLSVATLPLAPAAERRYVGRAPPMSEPMNRIASPDGTHQVELKNIGEIRFGPPYFALTVGGHALPSRIFGNTVKWSADSRFVAVQEWLSVDYSEGPRTKLLLIDVSNLSESGIVIVDGGFVRALAIEGGKITSTGEYLGTGRIVTFEHEIPPPHAWQPLP